MKVLRQVPDIVPFLGLWLISGATLWLIMVKLGPAVEAGLSILVFGRVTEFWALLSFMTWVLLTLIWEIAHVICPLLMGFVIAWAQKRYTEHSLC